MVFHPPGLPPLSLSPCSIASHSSAVFIFSYSLHLFTSSSPIHGAVTEHLPWEDTHWRNTVFTRVLRQTELIGYPIYDIAFIYIDIGRLFMYVCMYVCTYVCMYVSIYLSIYTVNPWTTWEGGRSTDPCTVENPCITLQLALYIQGPTSNQLQIV